MKWKASRISWPGGCEERYVTELPVFGRLVLRRRREGGTWMSWRIGPFGESGHELKPKTVRYAKAAAKRYLLDQLEEAKGVICGESGTQVSPYTISWISPEDPLRGS